MNSKLNRFQVGRTYATRSICDYDCIFSFKILGRTAKTVTIQDPHTSDRRTVKRRLYVWEDNEQFKPHGNYSMAAIVGADDLVP
jgi:hypothetical protein